MNELVALAPPIVQWPVLATERMALCRELATARLVPAHFQKSPADIFLAMNTIERLGLDFFLTIGECYVVQNKLGFSGKLAQAMLNTSGRLAELVNHTYTGAEGSDDRIITTTARIAKELEPRTITVRLGDVRTRNENWSKIPDQMLGYYAARTWGRRHLPEVLLGMQFKEELEDMALKDVTPKKEAPARVIGVPDPARPEIVETDPKNPRAPIATPAEPTHQEPYNIGPPVVSEDPTQAWHDWCKHFIGHVRGAGNVEELERWLYLNFELLERLKSLEPKMYRNLEDAIEKRRGVLVQMEPPQ